MSDDPKKRGRQDRSRINTSEDYEVRYWSKKFGVSPDQLKAAVKKVGNSVAAVQQEPQSLVGRGVLSRVRMSRPRKTMREKMSEWVLHCAVDQRHVRRTQATRHAALEDACRQLAQGHSVNRIIGPNETINAHAIKEWCAKHRSSPDHTTRRAG